jgi:hypothetical protein
MTYTRQKEQRPPCGGWPQKPLFSLNGYRTHDGNEIAYTSSLNVTEFSGSAPEPRNTSNVPICAGLGDPPYGPYTIAEVLASVGTSSLTFDNVYTTSGSTVISASRCAGSDNGYKNVEARKVWHGRHGYLSDCTGYNYNTASATKYLRQATTEYYSYALSCDFGCTPATTIMTSSRDFSVAFNSGIVTLNSCTQDVGTYAPDDSIKFTTIFEINCAADWFHSVFDNFVAIYQAAYNETNLDSTTQYKRKYYAPEDATYQVAELTLQKNFSNYNRIEYLPYVYSGSIGYSYNKEENVDIADSELIYTYDFVFVAGDGANTTTAIHIHTTSDLSDTIDADALKAHNYDLLHYWELTDDLQYPIRTDANYSVCPLIRRLEQPTAISPNMYGPSSCSFADANSSYYDGRILGKPLPIGCANYFQWFHETYNKCNNLGDILYYIESYGAYVPSGLGLPATTTEWTDVFVMENADSYPMGGFVALNGIWNDDGHIMFQDSLVSRKWYEAKISLPSHNFARPCGCADREAMDGNSSYCSASVITGSLLYPLASGFCGEVAFSAANGTCSLYTNKTCLKTGDRIRLSGSLTGNFTVTSSFDTASTKLALQGLTPYISGSGLASVYATDWRWNDDESKGDFAVLEYYNDYATVADRITQGTHGMPPAVSRFIVNMSCMSGSICCGKHILITPNTDEIGPNTSQFVFPNVLPIDDINGTLWQAIPQQYMTDPLWRIPPKPCDELNPDYITWKNWEQDTGECLEDSEYTMYYAHAPIEEFLQDVPSNAPSLPSGSAIGAYSLTELANVSLSGERNVYGPPTITTYSPLWIFRNMQKECVCSSGRFSVEYENNKVICPISEAP